MRIGKVFLVFAATVGAVDRWAIAQPGQSISCGDQAPEFEVRVCTGDQSRELLNLEKLRGNAVILEFWATWCVPCVNAREHLVELEKKFRGRKVSILSVSNEPIERVCEYLAKNPVPYKVAVDESKKIGKLYGVSGLPHAVLIDPKGIARWLGDPRDLTAKRLDAFLRTGETPPLREDRTVEDSRPKNDTLLRIQIGRSKSLDSNASAISQGFKKNSIELNCRSTRLGTIIGIALDRGGPWLSIDSDLASECYDVEFYLKLTDGSSPDLRPLIRALEETLAISITKRSEDSEVWVMHAGTPRVPEAKGAENLGPDENGMYQAYGVKIEKFIRLMGSRFKVLLIDETNLSGTYKLSIPLRCSFEEFRNHMASEYGITFAKENRKIDRWYVERRKKG